MSWEITLLYFFSWNFIWFLQKEPIKVQNFRLSTAQVKFHQICTLIGSFCWKYIKFQLKSTEELCLMILKSDPKFEEKLICCFKNYKNWANFDPSTQKSKKCVHFDWSLLCRVYNVWHKKVQRSYLSWQNLRKNWFVVWKMTWGIWQIFIRTLESVKIGTFMRSCCPK